MPWDIQLLSEMRKQGDPRADEAIAQLVLAHGNDAVQAFFQSLISNIRLPLDVYPEIVGVFLESASDLPEWYRDEDMVLAADYFTDHGAESLLLLYFKSLPLLYSCADGAQVLTRTGRLAHNGETHHIFARRIGETGQFLLDVMCEEALATNGPGLTAIQKVRLIHASIRQFVRNAGWNELELGTPVHQLHQAGTLMTFSIAIIDGLRQMGIIDTPAKELAYLKRWNVIGHLLGIDSRLLPNTLDDARSLLSLFLQLESRESEDGKLLAEALILYGKNAIPRERLDIIPEILIRFFTGTNISDRLGVSRPDGCLGLALPQALSKLFGLVEKYEDRDPRIQQLSSIAATILLDFTVNSFNKDKNSKFRIPESLRRKWGSRYGFIEQ